MKYSYPAILSVDKDDAEVIVVKIPDIYGAETCGIGETDAIEKAHDLLVQMLLFEADRCGEPHTYQEALEAFPTKRVVMIEVEF